MTVSDDCILHHHCSQTFSYYSTALSRASVLAQAGPRTGPAIAQVVCGFHYLFKWLPQQTLKYKLDMFHRCFYPETVTARHWQTVLV